MPRASCVYVTLLILCAVPLDKKADLHEGRGLSVIVVLHHRDRSSHSLHQRDRSSHNLRELNWLLLLLDLAATAVGCSWYGRTIVSVRINCFITHVPPLGEGFIGDRNHNSFCWSNNKEMNDAWSNLWFQPMIMHPYNGLDYFVIKCSASIGLVLHNNTGFKFMDGLMACDVCLLWQ